MIKTLLNAINQLDSVTLGKSLSDPVFLRDKDESITRDKRVMIDKLLAYSNYSFGDIQKYESFYVVN
ncbi:hypothetical protein, partial [Methanocalculus natronophilus]|uniref:hypothetical protein n=1 Tax=Methanocalculus natronophilus TaxID=1262400 RepID=UPI0031B5FD4D